MTKECKKARNTVLIPLVVLVGLLMLCSSCASNRAGCGTSNSWANNSCPAYR